MAVAELNPGDELGPDADGSFRYRVVRVLGAGGFGITYLVHDRRLQGEAVVKELACSDVAYRDSVTGRVRPARGQKETHHKLVERFVREAQLLNRLRNPHIVRVTDVWEERGTAYYAMDKVDAEHHLGAPDADGVTTSSWTHVRAHAEQLLDALDAVHAAGLVHGDVKPANVLLDRRIGVVLIDFGTARDDTEFYGTITSTSFTRGYAPPELMHPNRVREAGPWSDLYSWAMVVWGLVLPHGGDGGRPVDAVARAQGFDPYVDAAGQLSAAGVPEPWANVVEACLRLAPHERPKSVAEVQDRLGIARKPTSAPTSGLRLAAASASSSVASAAFQPTVTHNRRNLPAPLPVAAPAPKPSSTPWAAIAAVLMAVAVGLGWVAVRALADGDVEPPINEGSAGAAPEPGLDDGCSDCSDDQVCRANRCVTADVAIVEEQYRRMVDAWNAAEAKAYFTNYADTIDCYYARADLPQVELRALRGRHFAFNDGSEFMIDALEIVRADTAGVVLRDTGRFITAEGAEKPHEKTMLFARTEDGYRIVAEVSSAAHECAPHLAR